MQRAQDTGSADVKCPSGSCQKPFYRPRLMLDFSFSGLVESQPGSRKLSGVCLVSIGKTIGFAHTCFVIHTAPGDRGLARLWSRRRSTVSFVNVCPMLAASEPDANETVLTSPRVTWKGELKNRAGRSVRRTTIVDRCEDEGKHVLTRNAGHLPVHLLTPTCINHTRLMDL